MTEPDDPTRSTVVPDAAQLRGETPDELKPEDVLPIGQGSETEHLVDRDDQD